MKLYTKLKRLIHFFIWSRINDAPAWLVEWWQFYSLNAFFKVVSKECKIYRDLYNRSGINFTTLESTKDMETLPIISKVLIKKQHFKVEILGGEGATGLTFSHRVLACFVCREDGVPFKIFMDKKYYALWLRFLSKVGYQNINFSKTMLIFNVVADSAYFWSNNIMIMPRKYLKSREEDFVRSMIDFQPSYMFIDSYSDLIHTADLYQRKNLSAMIKMNSVMANIVFLPGEERSRFEKIFGCRIFLFVYELFSEAPFLGWECEEHNGFHLNRESYILEITNENGKRLPPGKIGRVVITSFNNEVMPFFRYDIGSRGYFLKDTCKCGRNSPRFMIGEDRPRLILKKRNINFDNLYGIFKFYHGVVDKFQIVQVDPDSIKLVIAARKHWDSSFEESLVSQVKEELGPSINLHLEVLQPNISR